MKLSLYRGVSGLAALFVPLVSFAATTGPQDGFGNVGRVIATTIAFINFPLIPFVFAIAFFMFLWGMFRYFFWSGASSEGQENGKQLMLWSVIAFVVMVSLWGIVNVVAGGLGFSGDSLQAVPTVPSAGGTSGNGVTSGTQGLGSAGGSGVPGI